MAQSSPSASLEIIDADERISLSDIAQMERVARKLGVSVVHLREVIAQVGPRLEHVVAKLTQRDSVD